MDFISNREPQIQEMLQTIGIPSIDALFEIIPQTLRCPAPTADDGLSEFEGIQLMHALAAKNTFAQFDNYLGAGAYEHHVPAIVNAICAKSEFLTSYTPYQAEISQGMLQVIFEFQSAMCALTGLDVSNASVYDGAAACAEAILMALRLHPDRRKILIAQSVNPYYRSVIDQYLASHAVEVITLPTQEDGSLALDQLKIHLDVQCAALLVQSPNFLGVLEDVSLFSSLVKSVGAYTILCANPMAYGLFRSAAEQGVDIAVGDCQPFGIPLQFGGPYAGYMTCRQELVRQLPGRIVGETIDAKERRGFVLTLQAREQHIRREKATSSICTNQALAALAALTAILWYGKQGVRQLALTCYQRTAYLKQLLQEIPGITFLGQAPFFNEFVFKTDRLPEIVKQFRQHNIEPGLDLGRYNKKWKNHLLVAVTETKNQGQLDRYAQILKTKE